MAEKYVEAQLPRDKDNFPIQVLAPGTPVNAALTGTSTDSSLAAGTEIVEIGLTEDAYIRWSSGGITVTSSNGQFLKAGVYVYRVPQGVDTVSHLQEDTSGRITLTPLT